MIRRRPGAFTAALGSPAGGDANRVSSRRPCRGQAEAVADDARECRNPGDVARR